MDATADLIATFNSLSAVARDRVRLGIELVQFDDKGEGHFDPVTSIDRDIERAMRRYLQDAYPDHGVWGRSLAGRTRAPPSTGVSIRSTALAR